MYLVNKTPLAARLNLSRLANTASRIGIVTAKATFAILTPEREGEPAQTRLDTTNPYPLFSQDEETDLGLLPRDDLPRVDPPFEVIVLGAAYALQGKPVEQLMVAVLVGGQRRELMVFGDRVWEDHDGQRRISRPQSFIRMPLTWANAFGGSCDIFVDKDSPVTVADSVNRLGKGFDPSPAVPGLVETLNPPEGFPVFDPVRRLPNVEDPAHLITRWEDAPKPACWATVPLDSGLHSTRSLQLPADDSAVPRLAFQDGVFHRAHPDWIIPLPAREALITLEGLRPGGHVAFRLPALQVFADFVVGDRSGTRKLVPQLLVLLPEEMRCYLVYRHVFNLTFQPGDERGMRLRTAEGW
jgi:hypothetical protein